MKLYLMDYSSSISTKRNSTDQPSGIPTIYRKEKFPGREELMSELSRYETTVNQVARLTKDEQGVTANLATRSRVC